MRVLQTLALPLGHVAEGKIRAGDGARTHDLLLGKETFYQLNYTRNGYAIYSFVAAIILLSFPNNVNPFLKKLFE
jgi:hypothetical protein